MLKIPKEMCISESWLQIFVDQTMLWNDDRKLRRYIQFLIDSDLAPAPSGRPANGTWSQALLAAEDNFSIDVIRYLQLASVENGGSPDLIERDDIPQEHWKDVYIGLRGTYRSYLGDRASALG